MSIHEKQKSCKLFRRIKAGIISAVMFTGSVMTNYAGLIENSTMFAAGEETAGISEESGTFTLKSIAPKLDYEITLKPNGQWKVTLKPKLGEYMVEIPENIMSASEFDDYRDNIDEVMFPNGITKIAAHAFEGMKSLHTVSGGFAVNEIGEAAFKDCTYLTWCQMVSPQPGSGVLNSAPAIIGKEAFSNTGLTEVKMSSSLKEVGEKAFYGCKDLTSISFSGNNSNEVIFGAESFADCTALKDIDLQKCTGSITFENGGSEQRSVFHNCTALEEVTVPASAKGNLNSLFRGATALKTITFADNSMITEVTHIVSGSPVEVLDLTPLKGLTEIGNWCFSGDKSITKVIIPSNVNSFGFQAMAEMDSLGTVEFAEGNTAQWLGNELFKNDTSLNSINLEVLSNLLSISESAFDGCTALTSITIPDKVTEIQANAFGRCVGLVDLKYNATNLTNVGNGIFDGAGIFNLTIGKNVQTIDAKFLSQAQDHISDIKFDGTPTFTITGEGDLNAPFEVGCKYSVDENGNLYKIEESGEAELVYANKTKGEMTIPESVNGHKVTGIATDAFKNANVTSLTIAKPENITTLEDYAFANATLLSSINSKTTVKDVKELFKGITEGAIQDNVFYKTAIDESIKDDTKEEIFPPTGTAEKQKHGTAIEIDRPNADGTDVMSLNYTVENDEAEIQDDDTRKGKFWTGETAVVKFAYNGGRPVRIYIKADKNAEINMNGNQNVFQTDIEGIYYYDVTHIGSETSDDALNLSYPNFSPPGSKMQVWAVEFNTIDDFKNYFSDDNAGAVIYPGQTLDESIKDTAKVSDKYFEIEWTTKPIDFTLTKSWATNNNLNFIKSDDNQITVSNLKWNIIFKKADAFAEDKNLGSDIVRYVDYTDTLVLPDKLSWREKIGDNLDKTHFVKKGKDSTLYITIDEKEYELFTLTDVDNLVDMSIKKADGDGKYSLCWRVINPNTKAEISPIENGYITFGPEVIVVDNTIEAGQDIDEITNNISADEYFTFSNPQHDEDDATTIGFTAPESKLIFNKERMNDVSHMGEDVQYKITVENPSVFTYTDMQKITDNLNADGQEIHYIKPENMQALFNQDNGDKLTITINNAVLANKLESGKTGVRTLNNEKDINIFEQNTAADNRKYKSLAEADESVAHRNVTITLHKNSAGNIELKCTGGSPTTFERTITIGVEGDYKDIASALDSIGYIVTSFDSYQLEWDFGENYQFEGGKTMEFTIDASIKNSLMYLAEKDQNYYYGWPQELSVSAFNTAGIDNSVEYSATTPQQNVTKDLEIRKRAYVGDRELNETYQPKDDDVIDYFVKAMHYGSGSYKVLPVVDHMTGRQVVIVDAEKNSGAEWASQAEEITIDGVKYYVLNKENYTYKGVYTSEYFYADSITVEQKDDGLDTLIKYYIENTPEIDFDVDVTYKAIVSKDLSGDKSTATEYMLSNEAWLNDRPGHRIYDTLGLSGSAVEFDKKILVNGMQDNPEDEELLTELPIKKLENEVTYRLMLHSTSPVTKDDDDNIISIGDVLTLTNKDIYDKLPLTGSTFTWSTANISNITYRAGENGYRKDESNNTFPKDAPGEFYYNGDKLEGLSDKSEWTVVDKCPSEKKKTPADGSQPVEDPSDQRYIQWNDSFKITLPPQATVYMYVTLTFPNDDTTWTKFMEEKGTEKLVNTFYVYDMPTPVTHTLSDPPVAFLQKGVYETGSYVTQTDAKWLTEQYFSGPDRFHYSNTYKEGRLKNTVTYYVVLRNSGSTNLYLAPIYDILPPGFEYMGLRTSNGSGSQWYDVGHNNTNETFGSAPTQYGGISKILAKPGEDDFSDSDSNFVKTYVKYSYAGDAKHETADGCQILKFEFENANDGDNDKLSKDSNGKYFLKPGQYLHFGYTVYTGNNPITEAKNTVVMQYYDPLESDVIPELDDKTPVIVKDIHNTAPNNDGKRYFWENEKASEEGFNNTNNIDIIGNDKTPQWFASDVTVTRDRISPGIKKTVKEPMIPTDKSADWTVTSFNNSATELSGYTITDTLDLPLQFEGKFKYSLWGSDNNGSSSWYVSAGGEPNDDNSYLFEIAREGENGVKITSNTGTSQSTTIGGDAVELEAKTVCNKNLGEDVRAKFTVQISRDEVNKKEILTIGFSNEKWGIIPNGYSELKFSTPSEKDENNNATIDPGTYTNTAMFCPEDKNYDDRITQGKLVRDDDGNNVGVEHSAVVSIYTGSPSGSVKMIEEKEDKTNFTTSERDDNYIRLMDKTKIFTYTLEVRNLGTTSMKNLVIIDNLPQIGDQTTLRQESKRESEFQVDLAKEGDKIKPNVEVWLYENAETLDSSGLDRKKVSPANYGESIKHEVLKLGEDYTVEYSDKHENFDNDDWGGNNVAVNGENRWYNDPTENTRSIRIHLKNDITKNQAIQIRFDAQIRDDDDAKPGKIAWNTFGYSYNTGELVAKASPNKVGICIPGCPTLTKKVVDLEGKESKVSKNSTFEFIIYKNDKAIDFEDYTEETVAKTLKKANVTDFMYTKLEVDAGTSESKELTLENFLKFDYTDDERFNKFDEELESSFWETDKTYYIVELDTSEDYRYKSTNKADENNYSFKIDPILNTPLEFVNENLQVPVELPETGGKGTGMLVFSGLMMICLSAFFLVRNKRKHTQR